jgi:hypothetical protein
MTATDWQWQNTEPGTLALLGTPFRIVYEAANHQPFALYRGDVYVERNRALAVAKIDAERFADELREIGVI